MTKTKQANIEAKAAKAYECKYCGRDSVRIHGKTIDHEGDTFCSQHCFKMTQESLGLYKLTLKLLWNR